jgi:SAM-dependent methyltransferase
MEVLDLGSGVGGPARTLAAEFGCRVTGIDLTEEFCQAAILLSERTGLEGQVTFHRGNMLHTPFEDNSFDVVWSQHVQMNVPDKSQLYEEVRRILKPRGRFALYEVCAGLGGSVYFPVPWASDESISFLIEPPHLQRLLTDAGFRQVAWNDDSAAAIAWYREVSATMRARPADAPPPVGLNLLMGDSFPEKFRNLGRNLEEDRIRVVQAVFDIIPNAKHGPI